jgi:hypothetical protein
MSIIADIADHSDETQTAATTAGIDRLMTQPEFGEFDKLCVCGRGVVADAARPKKNAPNTITD